MPDRTTRRALGLLLLGTAASLMPAGQAEARGRRSRSKSKSDQPTWNYRDKGGGGGGGPGGTPYECSSMRPCVDASGRRYMARHRGDSDRRYLP